MESSAEFGLLGESSLNRMCLSSGLINANGVAGDNRREYNRERDERREKRNENCAISAVFLFASLAFFAVVHLRLSFDIHANSLLEVSRDDSDSFENAA
jgi:hypothetical protein